MGPLMLDLTGTQLDQEEKELLDHPNVGGVILFTRNYESPQQVSELVRSIREAARDEVLIAVDHEGGRVQRFRQGFSAIPAMGDIYPKAAGELTKACDMANQLGYLMALEVLAVGIDISFAPVLDIWGVSEVIGDRSFHQDQAVITAVGGSFIDGMMKAGMQATGKHFPGHGNVLEDSHIAIPVDRRSEQEIFAQDVQVFAELIKAGKLAGMMPAHVIYPAIDSDMPAGFSRKWVSEILRGKLGFNGVVFSDDLAMAGATVIGSFGSRAEQALEAGCDMVLVCNHRQGAIDVLEALPQQDNSGLKTKLMTLRSHPLVAFEQLKNDAQWQQARQLTEQF